MPTIVGLLVWLFAFGCSQQDVDTGKPAKSERYSDDYLNSALATLSDEPDDVASNEQVWRYYTETGRYEALVAHAEPVFRRSIDVPGRERLALASGAFISQVYVLRERNLDSVGYYLNRITPLTGGEHSTDFLDALTHNITALFYLKTELDYSTALEHYQAAFAIMEKSGRAASQSTLLSNIASMYANLRDPESGLEYALRAYEISHSGKQGSTAYVRMLSAIQLGRLHCLKGDLANALKYADEASEDAFPQFMSNLDLLYADIALAGADYRRAERYYRQAIDHGKDAEQSDNALIYLQYGLMLSHLGRYDEANRILHTGLDIQSMSHRHGILLALSDVAMRQGRDREALDYYKEYHAWLDSISFTQRERAFQQYRLLVKDNELQSRELDLQKANSKIIIIVAGLALILLVAVALWVVNRRQSKMYRRLVEAHQQSLTRLGAMRGLNDKDEKHEHDKDDRDLQLWCKLTEIMDSEQIYRYSDISLDRIAEILGTNRAYVSRVINKYADTSFYNYIHSRRIEDASRILSDITNDIPLKTLALDLGYNSISSFYRAFIKETGVPPSRYKEELLKIKG
jgi:AraC-like DNA-binding protein